jgi:hypothetical protein
MAIGVFCRLLEINIDSKNRIRPLVDPGPDHDFDLLNFHHHFVNGIAPYQSAKKVQVKDYLPSLGVTVQKHVFPHPIRVYDVATLHLIVCTGGGHLRASRKGLGWLRTNLTTAVDFLVHSVVLRCLGKTHALKSWCEYSRKRLKRTGTWFLPGVDEVDDFLAFVKKAIATTRSKKRKNECHDFTSDQFLRTLDDNFKTFRGLEQVLQVWKKFAHTTLKSFAGNESISLARNSRETFIASLVRVFVLGGCNQEGDKLKFVCSQICADMEELIDELPFGEVLSVCTGPGSKAGYAVFQEENHAQFRKKLRGLSVDQLLMTGLERDSRGQVRIIYNKRYHNLVDMEHGGCKIGVYVPKLPGGGGSISVQPRKQAPHCHPVCNTVFDPSISAIETERIKKIASNAIQAFKRAVLNDTWLTPEGTVGEHCWKRPTNYTVDVLADSS